MGRANDQLMFLLQIGYLGKSAHAFDFTVTSPLVSNGLPVQVRLLQWDACIAGPMMPNVRNMGWV